MLALKPNCEACDRDLAPDALGAMICTFECTFCESCGVERFRRVCPNCGGELVARPARPSRLLGKYPGSTERVHGNHGDA
ncbi:MAG: DUF1272 domain-containing protein [Pseudomonadota bacterium]